MKEEISTTHSASETHQMGIEFAKKIKASDVVFLRGDLGAGKTTFVQGLAKGLGVNTRIVSPTFVLVREHVVENNSIKTLYHLDLYRLGSKEDVENVDLKDFLNDKNGVVVIEWPDISQKLVNKDIWEIFFKIKDENTREVKISYGGK